MYVEWKCERQSIQLCSFKYLNANISCEFWNSIRATAVLFWNMEIPSRILRSLPPFKHFLLSCIFGWQREQSELKIWKSAMKNLCRRTNTLSIDCFYFRNNWLSLNEYFSILINQIAFKFLVALFWIWASVCEFGSFSLALHHVVLMGQLAGQVRSKFTASSHLFRKNAF